MLQLLKSLFEPTPHYYVYTNRDGKWFSISSIDYGMETARTKEALMRKLDTSMEIKYARS